MEVTPLEYGPEIVYIKGIRVTSFLDTPYVMQTVCVLFGNRRITFANVFYVGPLMRFLIQPTAVTNTPR